LEKAQGTPRTLICGEVLVVAFGGQWLHGLDTDDGAALWSTKTRNAHTATVGSLSGDTVLLTGAGRIIAPGTGKVLVSGLPTTEVAPQVHRDVVYTAGRQVSAQQYGTELLWRSTPDADEPARPISPPIVFEGLVYILDHSGLLSILDAQTGEAAPSYQLPAKPTAASHLLLGGRHLYATNLGEDRCTVVLKPGRQPEQLWQYTVPGATVAPCFLANQQFIAGADALFCIGGQPPQKPEDYTPIPEVAAIDYQAADGVPVVEFKDNQMPMQWLYSRAIKPRTLKTDFLASAGTREKIRVKPGQTISYDGGTCAFAPLDSKKSVWSHPKFTAGFDAACVRYTYAAGEDTKEKNDHSTVYLYTIIDNDKPRFVELRVLCPNDRWNSTEQIKTAVWLNGVRVEDEGIAELAAGRIPMMIQVAVGSCGTDSGKIWLAPRLIDRTDKYAAAKAKHLQAVKVWEQFQASKQKPLVLE
jgi:hypothetical protein